MVNLSPPQRRWGTALRDTFMYRLVCIQLSAYEICTKKKRDLVVSTDIQYYQKYRQSPSYERVPFLSLFLSRVILMSEQLHTSRI